MAYIVTTMWYPLSKVKEVGETYLKTTEKYPPDDSLGTIVIPAAITSNENGLEVFSVTEAKEGKLPETLERAANILIEYWGIEGFNYKTRVLSTLEEGLTVIGMG